MESIVTIAVATYNSADYVIETLESVYNQTYTAIALLVSDDCSKDNTVELVTNWLAQNKIKSRFQSIEVITVPENTGVSANCNRCLAAIQSDYFKFIAGDDILFENCIEDNMNFVEEYPQAKIIFSQVKLYQDDFQEQNYIKTTPLDFPNNFMANTLSAKDQYHLLLLSDRIHYTPSVFMNKEAILKVGGYDESDRLVEDYPMWLKLTNSGVKLDYFHKVTVGYRVHSSATNNNGQNVLFKPSVINSYSIKKKKTYPFLPWEIIKSDQFIYLISLIFQKLGLNKNTFLLRKIYYLIIFYANPFYYVYAIKKRLPMNKNNVFYS